MLAWQGRRLGPLLTMWAAACAFLAALAWLQHEQPALDEIFVPIYIVAVLVAIWSTIKWFRTRPDRWSAHDRRHGNRRRADLSNH